jgi:hypothetical protein
MSDAICEAMRETLELDKPALDAEDVICAVQTVQAAALDLSCLLRPIDVPEYLPTELDEIAVKLAEGLHAVLSWQPLRRPQDEPLAAALSLWLEPSPRG